MVSFVASGHVVIFDAESRTPLQCFETTVGSTGTRQAHAAFPAPDGSYILVANQNGKRLERIDTDLRPTRSRTIPRRRSTWRRAPRHGGSRASIRYLRPINWPICPIIDSSSTYGFVTLRGGGLFVVNARTTPMSIVAEYDKTTVSGNGCGGIELGGHMYINSGGSPVNVSSPILIIPTLYGFDVYQFPLTGYFGVGAPNSPAPTAAAQQDRACPTRMASAPQAGRALSLGDGSARQRRGDHRRALGPVGEHGGPRWRAQRATRLPISWIARPPATGCSSRCAARCRSAAIRTTRPAAHPASGIIEVTEGGRSGGLAAVVPLTNPLQQPNQAPDAHGLRVRLTRR